MGFENGRFAGWMTRILEGFFFWSLLEIAYRWVAFSEKAVKDVQKGHFLLHFFTYTLLLPSASQVNG